MTARLPAHRLQDQLCHFRRLIPLRPVGCALDKTDLCMPEQTRQMTCEVGAEVMVSCAENQRDGKVEGRQVARGDVRVLLLKRGKEVCGPRSDSGERLRLGFVAEELRQKRVDCDSVLVCGVHPELAASAREQPQQ